MKMPYGLITQISEDTGLSKQLVSCVLTSSVKRRRKPDKASIEKIAKAMNKLGYNITALDLSVGHGISFSPLSIRLREKHYLLSLSQQR